MRWVSRARDVLADQRLFRGFYLHHDFEPSPTDPLHLMLLIVDARAIVPR
jgi:hypothetical protein